MNTEKDQGQLPGEELVRQGLADLSNNWLSEPALLVLIAGPRLTRLGIAVPEAGVPRPFEHMLYIRLNERLGQALTPIITV